MSIGPNSDVLAAMHARGGFRRAAGAFQTVAIERRGGSSQSLTLGDECSVSRLAERSAEEWILGLQHRCSADLSFLHLILDRPTAYATSVPMTSILKDGLPLVEKDAAPKSEDLFTCLEASRPMRLLVPTSMPAPVVSTPSSALLLPCGCSICPNHLDNTHPISPSHLGNVPANETYMPHLVRPTTTPRALSSSVNEQPSLLPQSEPIYMITHAFVNPGISLR